MAPRGRTTTASSRSDDVVASTSNHTSDGFVGAFSVEPGGRSERRSPPSLSLLSLTPTSSENDSEAVDDSVERQEEGGLGPSDPTTTQLHQDPEQPPTLPNEQVCEESSNNENSNIPDDHLDIEEAAASTPSTSPPVAELVPDDIPTAQAIMLRTSQQSSVTSMGSIDSQLVVEATSTRSLVSDRRRSSSSTRRSSRGFGGLLLDSMDGLGDVREQINDDGGGGNSLLSEIRRKQEEEDCKKECIGILIMLCVLGIGALGLSLLFLNKQDANGMSFNQTSGRDNSSSASDWEVPVQDGFYIQNIFEVNGNEPNSYFGSSIALTLNASHMPIGATVAEIVDHAEARRSETFVLKTNATQLNKIRFDNSSGIDDNPHGGIFDVNDLIGNEDADPLQVLLDTQGDDVGYIGEESSVDITAFGYHVAIGYPSTSGLGSVKVFAKNKADNKYEQLGNTIYGQDVKDGFGSSVAISVSTKMKSSETWPLQGPGGLLLLVGSNNRYAQLWGWDFASSNSNGTWVRHDQGELRHKEEASSSQDNEVINSNNKLHDDNKVVVSLAGSGSRLFVSYPYAEDYCGLVRAYDVKQKDDSDGRVEIHQVGDTLKGAKSGDLLGISLSTDLKGAFVAIGAKNYVQTMVWIDWIPPEGAWKQVGSIISTKHPDANSHDSSDKSIHMTVATGRVPYKSCVSCPLSLEKRRIAVGFPGEGLVRVYQYREDDLEWTRIGDDIQVGEEQNEVVGAIAVAMSTDSGYVAVGSPLFEDGRGRVNLYGINSQVGEN